MATSTNYGWAEPDNSSLVKNGASDIRTLGNAIDTSVWNIGYGQAGKNKIINGDFGIWQRGTSFSADASYTADRWKLNLSGATATVSRQSFTVGQTDVIGNPTYFARLAVTTGDNACRIETPLEDVTNSSSKTFTVSFWAKGTNPAGGSLEVTGRQDFGVGGSTAVNVTAGTITLTSSWQRFSKTFTFASVSGKTIGTGNWYGIDIRQPGTDTGTAAWTLDIANVQLEYGSIATPFQTASGGSIQGELALCQRYYYRKNSEVTGGAIGICQAWSTTQAQLMLPHPVTMRTTPSLARSGLSLLNATQSRQAVSAMTNNASTINTFSADFTASNLVAGNASGLLGSGTSTTDYIEASAEL